MARHRKQQRRRQRLIRKRLQRRNRSRFTRIASTAGFGALAALTLPYADSVVYAESPQGANVRHGDVVIDQNGNMTRITASDRAIIDYQSFNIGRDHTVQFIQPGQSARVLNRVLSGDPTRIDGTLSANGQVYIASPGGIFFGNQAVVDVAGLVAGAGSMADADFIQGRNLFTDMDGSVINAGTIQGDMVALIGEHVANRGTIIAPDGMITLAAGDEVFLGDRGGIMVRLEGGKADNETAAVENEGTLDAGDKGKVNLGAGDVYSLAVNNSGAVRGQQVVVSGEGGRVEVAGEIDASSDEGQGGDVYLLGDEVAVQGGATIDASGATGGGNIYIGGDYQGGGDLHTARRTLVTGDASLHADAIESGEGGQIIVWADGATYFFGSLSARGGEARGDGGFAEVSGGEQLIFDAANIDMGAAAGDNGTLLLDPRSITIQAANPDIAGDGSNNDITTLTDLDDAAGDFPGEDSIITAGAVDALLTGSNTLVLAATELIDVNAAITGTDSASLTLEAGNNININDSITLGGTLTLTGGDVLLDAAVDLGGDLAATGSAFTLGTNAAIDAGGVNISPLVTANASSDIISGGDITLGNGIDLGGNAVTLRSGQDGAGSTVTLDSVTGAAGSAIVFEGGAGTDDFTVTNAATADSVTLRDSVSSATFGGAVTADDLVTEAGEYNIEFAGGGTLTNAVAFNNSLGAAWVRFSGSDITFTGGVDTSQVSSTRLAVNVAVNNGEMNLGAVTLQAPSLLLAGNGQDVSVGSIAGQGNTLTLFSTGAAATIGSSEDVNTFDITGFDTVTASGPIEATSLNLDTLGTSATFEDSVTAGTVELLGGVASDYVARFEGAVDIDTLQSSNIDASTELVGGGTVDTAALQHTGGLTLAGGLTFTNGLTYGGDVIAQGNVATTTAGFDLGNVVASNDVTFNTGGNAFASGTIDGAHTVAINSGGANVAFGNVGGTTPLAGFNVIAGAGTITLNGNAINTAGDVTFGSTFQLTDHTTVATDGGDVDFSATTVTSSGDNYNLTLATATTGGGTAGDVLLSNFDASDDSLVGNLLVDMVDTTNGSLELSGGTISLAGDFEVRGENVTVADHATLATTGGTVDFTGLTGSISGSTAARELTITSDGGNVDLATVDNAGGALLGLLSVDSSSGTPGTITLAASTEAGGSAGSDAIALSGDVLIDGDRDLTAAGDITIAAGSTVYADAAGRTLSVDAGGAVNVAGDLGDNGIAFLETVTLASGTTTDITGNIEVADVVSVDANGAVTLDTAAAIAANQFVVLGDAGGTFDGDITADELQVTGTGNFAFAGDNAVGTLAADVAGDLAFNNAAAAELVIGSVTSDLAGAVAGVTTTVGGTVDITAADDLTVQEAVDGAGAVTLVSAGGTIDALAAIAGQGVTLDAGTGTFQSDAAGTVDAGGSQLLINADAVDINAALSSAGGDLLIQPETVAHGIAIGDATGAGLVIDQSEIDLFTEGFNSITIGRADGQHAIEIEQASFADSVLIRSPEGGSITVLEGGTHGISLRDAASPTGKTITLRAAGSTDSADAANEVIRLENDLLTSDGAIALELANGTHGLLGVGPEGGSVTISSAPLSTSPGGDITIDLNIGGTGNTVTADAFETLTLRAGDSTATVNGELNPSGAQLAAVLDIEADELTLPSGNYYGNPVFTADTILFPAGADSIVPVASGVAAGAPDLNLTLQPRTPGLDVGVGASLGSGLVITQANIDALADGFNSITIGRSDGSGFMTINEDASGVAMAFKDPMLFRMPNGEITIHDADSVASISQSETAVNADHIRNRTGSAGAAIVDPLTGALTFHSAAATTNIAGRVESNGTAIEFINAVKLTGDTVLATTGITGEEGTYTGADILFGGNVDGTTAAEENLTLSAGVDGDIRFGNTVGGDTKLGNVLIVSEGGGAAGDVSAIDSFRARSFTQSEGTGDTTFFADLTTRGEADPSSAALGEGGDVTILIDGVIRLLGTTDTRGGEPASADPGYAGGDIVLTTPDRVVVGAVVTDGSQAGTGDGGDAGALTIVDANEITLNGDITARGGTGDNTGAGGSIQIGSSGDTTLVTVDDDITIRTGSTGGNLTVISDLLSGDSNDLVLRLGTGDATFVTAVDDFNLIDVQNADNLTFVSPVSNVDHTEVAVTTDLTYNDTVSGGSITADVGDEALFVEGFNLTGTLLIESAVDVTVPGVAIAGSIQQESGTGLTQFIETVTTTATGGLDLSTNQISFIEAVDVTNGGGATLVNSGQLTITPTAPFTITGGQGFSQSGGGAVDLGANITTDGGSQGNISFGSTVRLIDSVTLSTDAGNVGDISLGGGVVAQTSGPGGETLTLTAGSGNIDVSGDIGAGSADPLNTLTVTSVNNANFLGEVSLVDFQQTLGTGSTVFGDDPADAIHIVEDITFDDVQNVTTNAPLTVVNGSLTVTSGNDLTFNEAIDIQSGDLTLTSARDVTFGSAVAVENDVLIGDARNVLANGTVDARSITQSDGSGNTTFNGDVTVNEGRDVGLDDIALSVETSGTVAFGGNLATLDAGNSMGGGDIVLRAGDVDFSGTTDSVTTDLAGGAHETTLTIEPLTASGNISVGDSSGGGIFLSGGDVDSISGDFRRIFVGRADGTGTMTIGNGAAFKSPTWFRMPIGSGSINITSGGVAGIDRGQLSFDTHAVNLGGTVATDGLDVYFVSGASIDTDNDLGNVGDGGAADDGLLDVTVTGTAAVNTTGNGSTDGAEIVLENTIDDDGGANPLTLNSGDLGDIRVLGAVGGSERLGALTIANAADATFEQLVNATSFTHVDGQGTTTFQSTLNTTGAIQITDATDLLFEDTVTAASFTQDAGQHTSFTGELTSLDTSAAAGEDGGDVEIDIAGDLLVQGDLLARGSDRTIPGNGRTGGTVDLVADTISVAGINTSGGTVVSGRGGDAGDIGLDAISGTIILRGDLTALGSDGTSGFDNGDAKDITLGNAFTAAVELTPDADYTAAADTVTLAGNDVTFNGTVDAATGADASLIVNTYDDASQGTPAGVTQFNGNVGESEALVALVTDSGEVNGRTELNAAFFNVGDLIEFNDAVVLEAAEVTLRGDAVGGHTADTRFNNTLNSAAGEANDLTIDAVTTEFNQIVGGATDGALGMLVTSEDSAADLTVINTSAIDAGFMRFHDAVEIAAGEGGAGVSTLTGGASGADELSESVLAVQFDGTIDSTAGQQHSLIVNTPNGGTTAILGDVGTVGADPSDAAVSTALGRLETDAAGVTAIGAGTINTLGASVEHNDPVQLANDVTYNEYGSGDVVFNDTVDSDGSLGNFALTINMFGGGTARFVGDVGHLASDSYLSDLTTGTDGDTEVHADVRAETITFGNPLLIGADAGGDGVVTLGAAETTNVTFAQTVDSLPGETNDLSILASSTVTFDGAVGDTDRLASLLVDGGNTTAINGGLIQTTGDQTFQDAIVLGDDTTLDASTGTITFNNTVDSDATARDLTATAGQFIHFNGEVGGAAALENLTADADDGGVRVTAPLTANDTITLDGTGGSSGSGDHGIAINNGATLTADWIVLTGEGGGDATSHGILAEDNVNIVADTVELHAAAYNGANAALFDTGSIVTATNLVLLDAGVASPGGAFVLDQDNAVGTLVGDTTGRIRFHNAAAGDLVIDTVTLADASDVSGITTAGSEVHITAGNNITSTAAGVITTTADANSGDASGDVILDSANGDISLAGEIVTTGAANNAGTASTGGDVTIDALLGDVELVAITSSGGAGSGANDGGDAGQIDVTASPTGSITLHDDLTAVGGTGDTAGLAGDITLTTDPATGDVLLDSPAATDPTITLAGNDVTIASRLGSLDDANPQHLVVNSYDAGVTHLQGAVGLGDDDTALTGDDRPLASLTTNADGETRISGGNVLTTGDQHYHDAVVLTDDTTFHTTGDGDVRFFATLDSENAGDDHDATFSLDDGTLLLGGMVGDTARLGDVLILTARDVIALDAVTVARLEQQAGTGSTTFLGHIDTTGAVDDGGDILITTDGWVALLGGATLNAATGSGGNGGDLTLNPDDDLGGTLDSHPQLVAIPGDTGYNNSEAVTGLTQRFLDIIVLNGQFDALGDGAGAGGTVSLSPVGRDAAPYVATIASLPTAGSDVTFNAGSFAVGVNEKTTIFGDFEVNTTDGHITVNDLSVLNDIRFDVASGSDIQIRRRTPGTVVTPSLLTQDDLGVDIVLGGEFHVNQVPVALGPVDPAQPIIASPGGEHDPDGDGGLLSSFVNRDFGGPLTTSLLSLPGGAVSLSNDLNIVLDLTAERATTANVSEAIAGAVPRPEQSGDVIRDTGAGQAQQEMLADLGILARDLTSVEFLWLLAGQRVYNDLGGDVQDDTRRVASTRLSFGLVDQVIASYRNLMFEEVMDEDTGEWTLASRSDTLRQTLGDAFAAYQQTGEAYSGEGFVSFVRQTPEHMEAINILLGLEELLERVELLGLTPGENAAVRTRLYRSLLPEGMSSPQLDEALEAVAADPAL